MARKTSKSKKNSWSRKEKETLFGYLCRVLSANRLQVIIGILSLVLAALSVYLMWPKQMTEQEMLEKSIKEKLALIETQIKPSSIKISNDSTGELELIKYYEIEVERYCSLYNLVSRFEYNVINNSNNSANAYFSQFKHNYNSLITQLLIVNEIIKELMKYASIDDTDYLIFDLKESVRLTELLEEQKNFYDKNDPTDLFNKKDYKRGLETLEKIRKNIISLRLQDCFFTNVVNMNNIISLRLNKLNYYSQAISVPNEIEK
jgi:hypothetical protein